MTSGGAIFAMVFNLWPGVRWTFPTVVSTATALIVLGTFINIPKFPFCVLISTEADFKGATCMVMLKSNAFSRHGYSTGCHDYFLGLQVDLLSFFN